MERASGGDMKGRDSVLPDRALSGGAMPAGPGRREGLDQVAMRKGAALLSRRPAAPEGFSYSVKRRLLGRPLVNEQLGEQRLSKPLALGVLSPDGISSSAYGTEEIIIALLPIAGL